MIVADVAQLDPLSGWAQVIIQTGALGLLAMILFRFPSWIQVILQAQEKERERRDELFRAERKSDREGFEKRSDAVTKAIQQQTVEIVKKIDENTSKLGEVVRGQDKICKVTESCSHHPRKA